MLGTGGPSISLVVNFMPDKVLVDQLDGCSIVQQAEGMKQEENHPVY